MKKYLLILAFLPVISWCIGMITFIALAVIGFDCPIGAPASSVCAIPMTLTWGGFAFIYLIYTVPLALLLYIALTFFRKTKKVE